MKIVYLGAFALAAAIFLRNETLPEEPEPDPFMVGSISGQERFSLAVAGEADGCVISISTLPGDSKDMALSAACEAQAPVLSGSSLWLERKDGSVAFIGIDGTVRAEFAAGDGVAFESYAPRQPPMILRSM